MAGGLFARDAELYCELEGTYGSDPTLVGADAVLVSNLSITPYAGNVVSRDFIRSYLGASTSINVGPHVQVTFDVEIAGAGTSATTEAKWIDLLKACGFDETAASPTVSKVYKPVSSAMSSVTLGFELSGEFQTVLGCRGNVSFNLSAGTIPKMSFTFLGLYARPTVATLTADFTGWQAPQPVTDTNMGTLTLDGYSFLTQSLTINMNNQLAYRNLVNGEYVCISNRNVTGQISFEAELMATKNLYALVESHTSVSTAVLAVVHGTGTTSSPLVPGSTVKFDAPKVQLSNITYSDSDGIRMYNCDLIFTPNAGNDELVITTL